MSLSSLTRLRSFVLRRLPAAWPWMAAACWVVAAQAQPQPGSAEAAAARAGLPAASAASGPMAGGLDVGAERARLNAERQRITQLRDQQEVDCRGRFAVTGCVEQARKRAQAPLAELDRQERVLNDLERRQRSADQLLRVERKQAEAQADAAERSARAASDQQAREARAASKASGPKPAGSPRGPQTPNAPSGPSPEQAQSNAEARADRVRKAEAHKSEVRQRQADRKKPPASDLPPLPR